MGFCTKMRLPAEQTSPWLMKTPNRAPSMAASKSASAKKMFGDLPPSSSVTRFTVSAACFTIILPTAALPVNAILLTSGCWTSGAPQVSPKPVMMLTTPGGRPQPAKYLELECSEWGLLGRLEDAGAACSDGGSQFPGGHKKWIVPRNDLPGDADWLF